MIYLFDLDNTIADMDHRLPMLDKDEIDWEAFEKECVHDKPIDSTIALMTGLYAEGDQVWIWTGRSDGVKTETIGWLKSYGVPYHQLLMRPKGTEVTTTQLKRRWLDDDPVPRRKVACAFDDDPRIVKMLLEEGVVAYHIRRPA